MQLILAVLLLVAATASAEEAQSPTQPLVVQPVAAEQAAPVAVPVEQPAHVLQPAEGHYAQTAHGPVHVVNAEPGSIAHKPISEQQVPKHYAVGGSPAVQSVPVEQYGQPESASIPANYKPFGSWGLYIGGNPADGYYTNFYKSLGSSVDKQLGQVAPVAPSEQSSAAPKPAALVGQQPLLRQALGPVYVAPAGPESLVHQAYPFEHSSYGANSYYTPAELSVGGARLVPPVAQGYGTPSASYEPSSSLLSYADAALYSTKRTQQPQQHAVKELARETQQQQQQQQQQTKGYQQRYAYAYASPVVQASGAQVASPAQQAQLVAYPVPVGSQIVGSQPGFEGVDPQQAYGVHAFTRYAIKPTLVSSAHEQTYFSPVFAQVSHVAQLAPLAYKQQQSVYQPLYQPLSFYGVPLGQLHYSAGSLGQSASEHQHQHQHAPAPIVAEQAASDKFEASNRSQDKQQQ